jgi:hypothetical protein
MKSMSILGIIFSGLIVLFFGGALLSGDVDENAAVGLGTIFGLWSVAFSIVALTNSNKK